MSITLKFFMIRRGLTLEKMATKSNSQSPDELIAYAQSLNIGVTKEDETLIRDYYSSVTEHLESEDSLSSVTEPARNTQPVPNKRTYGKKRVGKNV